MKQPSATSRGRVCRQRDHHRGVATKSAWTALIYVFSRLKPMLASDHRYRMAPLTPLPTAIGWIPSSFNQRRTEERSALSNLARDFRLTARYSSGGCHLSVSAGHMELILEKSPVFSFRLFRAVKGRGWSLREGQQVCPGYPLNGWSPDPETPAIVLFRSEMKALRLAGVLRAPSIESLCAI